MQKRNNTKKHSTNNTKYSKYQYTYYQNTHTLQNPYTHPHITKQVKTTTVQDIPKRRSHNIIKYPEYKVTQMYCPWHFYPQEFHRNSLHFTPLKVTSHKSHQFTSHHYTSHHFTCLHSIST